jgi:hypothetical protein
LELAVHAAAVVHPREHVAQPSWRIRRTKPWYSENNKAWWCKTFESYITNPKLSIYMVAYALASIIKFQTKWDSRASSFNRDFIFLVDVQEEKMSLWLIF